MLNRTIANRLLISLLSLLLLTSAGAVAGQQPQTTAPQFSKLEEDLGPLKEQFNYDRGHPRLLLLLSPT